MKFVFSLLIIILLNACIPFEEVDKNALWENEILLVEKEFANKVALEGIAKGFLYYAAEDAVLLRDNHLLLGSVAIRNSYTSIDKNENESLTWSPDFIDVSESGDMAYTYGEYIYSVKGVDGNVHYEKGIFHTIWKRQSNGDWKFVWD